MKETMSFSLDPYIASNIKTKKNQSKYVNKILSSSIGYDGLTNRDVRDTYRTSHSTSSDIQYQETREQKISRLKKEMMELFEELENE